MIPKIGIMIPIMGILWILFYRINWVQCFRVEIGHNYLSKIRRISAFLNIMTLYCFNKKNIIYVCRIIDFATPLSISIHISSTKSFNYYQLFLGCKFQLPFYKPLKCHPKSREFETSIFPEQNGLKMKNP